MPAIRRAVFVTGELDDFEFAGDGVVIEHFDEYGENELHLPKWVYDAVVQDYVKNKLIGRAVPCPGCDWSRCVDCHPELIDAYDRAEEELEVAMRRHVTARFGEPRVTFAWGEAGTEPEPEPAPIRVL